MWVWMGRSWREGEFVWMQQECTSRLGFCQPQLIWAGHAAKAIWSERLSEAQICVSFVWVSSSLVLNGRIRGTVLPRMRSVAAGPILPLTLVNAPAAFLQHWKYQKSVRTEDIVFLCLIGWCFFVNFNMNVAVKLKNIDLSWWLFIHNEDGIPSESMRWILLLYAWRDSFDIVIMYHCDTEKGG